MRARELFEDEDEFDLETELDELACSAESARLNQARKRWEMLLHGAHKVLYRNPETGFRLKLVRSIPDADLCWVYVYDEGGDFIDGEDFDLAVGQDLDTCIVQADALASTMVEKYSPYNHRIIWNTP